MNALAYKVQVSISTTTFLLPVSTVRDLFCSHLRIEKLSHSFTRLGNGSAPIFFSKTGLCFSFS